MRKGSLIVFSLSFLVMAIFLLLPLVYQGLSWEEATKVHALCLVVQFVSGMVLVEAGPMSERIGATPRVSESARLLGVSALFYVAAAHVVFFGASWSYETNTALTAAHASGADSPGGINPYEACVRNDALGIKIGIFLLFLGFLAGVGAILVRKFGSRA